MAPFNPTPQPVQDPNYIYWSRPTQRIQPNQAGELLGEGLGHAITDTAEGYRQITKSNIESDAQDQGKGITDQFVKRMSAANAEVGADSGPNEVLNGTPGQQPQGFPDDLKQLPSQTDRLLTAKSNGKLTPSGYDAQIYMLAQNLREKYKYSGFVDYVDTAIAKATGVHPGNQLVRSLINDYNTAQQNGNQNNQRLFSEWSATAGYPGVNEAGTAWQANPNSQTALRLQQAIIAAHTQENNHKIYQAGIEDAKAKNENVQMVATNFAQKESDGIVSNALSGSDLVKLPSGKTWGEVSSLPPDQQDPKDVQFELAWVNSQRQKLESSLTALYANSYPDVPADKREQMKKDALSIFEHRATIITNPESGMEGYHKRMLETSQQKSEYDFDQTSLGQKSLQAATVAKAFKDMGYDQSSLSMTMQSLTTGLIPDAKDFITSQFNKINSQYLTPITGSGTVPAAGTNTPGGVIEHIEDTFSGWFKGGVGRSDKPDDQKIHDANMFKNWIKSWTNQLTEKGVPQEEKTVAANYLYGTNYGPDRTQQVLDRFQHNYVDPFNRLIHGSEYLYDQMYGGKAWQAVSKQHPDLAQNFQEKAEMEGGGLINDSLAQLNASIRSFPPGSIGWDDSTHEFVLHPMYTGHREPGLGVGQPGEGMEDASMKVARPIINNINSVLRTLNSGVWQGQDADEKTMDFLIKAGYPNDASARVLGDLIIHNHMSGQQPHDSNVQ